VLRRDVESLKTPAMPHIAPEESETLRRIKGTVHRAIPRNGPFPAVLDRSPSLEALALKWRTSLPRVDEAMPSSARAASIPASDSSGTRHLAAAGP
jgi:hypothetical protein